MTSVRESATTTRIGVAALVLALSALLSRVLGYARDAVLARLFGAGSETDAYFAAFTIPDFLNYLLAGSALSIAFLPRYSRYREDGDEEGAERFLGKVLGTIGALALGVTALLWAFAPALVGRLFSKFDAGTQALTVDLTRIVLPAQVFFFAGGIIKGALFARGRFAAAALAPLIYNLCIILGGLVLGPRLGVAGFAWGVLVGGFLGPLLAPLLDARGRIRYRLRVVPRDREFLAYLTVALPLMLGQSLLTVDEWYERVLGATLASGSVAYLGYARRLMQVPVAIVGQAVATAALPTLAVLWARGEREALNRTVTRTLQASLAIAVIAAAWLALVARPLVRLLYQGGSFTAADSETVASLLTILTLAVPAWIAQQVATRAFYARNDTLSPMLLSTVIAIAALPLYWYLGRAFGIHGLCWAGVIGMSVNAAATLILAHHKHAAPLASELASTVWRSAVIAGAATTSGALLQAIGGRLVDATTAMGALVIVVSVSTIFAVVTAAGLLTIADPPSRAIARRLTERMTRLASKRQAK